MGIPNKDAFDSRGRVESLVVDVKDLIKEKVWIVLVQSNHARELDFVVALNSTFLQRGFEEKLNNIHVS